MEQLFLLFLKNKVAYVPYHNLKDYLVSRGVVLISFRIPVTYQEKIRWEWVQMCGYEACVFCMPIPLRICLSGSAHCQ